MSPDLIDTGQARPPALHRDIGGVYLANAIAAFMFAASGPVAIIFAVGTKGGLSEADLASWVFGAFSSMA